MSLDVAPALKVPAELEGHEIIASVSGGKDSTALLLALREAGIPFRAVFADTGWEHDEVYYYLDAIRQHVCPVDVARMDFDPLELAGVMLDLGMERRWVRKLMHSAMAAACLLSRAGFPARKQRFCTRELKIKPLREYCLGVEHEVGRPTASAVGVRADESPERQALLANDYGGVLEREAEGTRGWGHWVWRPLLRWTEDEVYLYHRRHGVPLNPLYRRGHDRVGCAPCIHANKGELALLADDEERVGAIRALEAAVSELRRRRNLEKPGRYKWPDATFFQGRQTGPLGVAPDIDTVLTWARTSRGGRQLQLIPSPPSGGCLRTGLCDTGTWHDQEAAE